MKAVAGKLKSGRLGLLKGTGKPDDANSATGGEDTGPRFTTPGADTEKPAQARECEDVSKSGEEKLNEKAGKPS